MEENKNERQKIKKKFNLKVSHQIEYDVILNNNILSIENNLLSNAISNNKVYCLVDKNVIDLYGKQIADYFAYYKIEYYSYIIDSSEVNKSLETVVDFASFCFKNNIYRRDVVICFGGGITCDIGGLTANLIRRGTPCIKIPTSLMGIVDAAIGVKTGVNYFGMKNSLGTYSHPAIVFCDLDFLKTLPERQMYNGLVEIVKIIALLDKEIWMLLYNHIESFFKFPYDENVEKIISHSIHYMLEELKPNLFEKDLRRIVDYGHEFGHAIEVLTNYSLLHGEAVGIGMIVSNCIALNQGVMNKEDFDIFIKMYQKLNNPFFHKDLNEENIFSVIKSIKEHKNGNIDLVVLEEIGKPHFLKQIYREDVNFAIKTLKMFTKKN